MELKLKRMIPRQGLSSRRRLGPTAAWLCVFKEYEYGFQVFQAFRPQAASFSSSSRGTWSCQLSRKAAESS